MNQEEHAERYHPDSKRGLTQEQVAHRQAEGLTNVQPAYMTKTIGRIIKDHALTLFHIFNVLIALCLVLVESYNNLLFLLIAFCNLVIGISQEIKSKYTIEKLSLLSVSDIQVVRDGRAQDIKVSDIVLDDVVCLFPGKQIPADAIVLDGEVEVNEALLTGESDAVMKQPGDALLSGSFVMSGSCRAQIIHVGAENYTSQLTAAVKTDRTSHSHLMHDLKRIIRTTSCFIVPLGALLFLNLYVRLGDTLKSAVEQSAAAMIGMMPAGLILLTSVSLAVGAITLARKKALVQELYGIEALSRVDVLCLDKTGTLTEGSLEVVKVTYLQPENRAQTEQMLWDFNIAVSQKEDNLTSRALRRSISGDAVEQPIAVEAFSSACRCSTAVFNAYHILQLGAPDALCPHLDIATQKALEDAAQNGYRVLLFATRSSEAEEATPLAYLLLSDRLRKDAKETLRFFMEQGVTVKLISGDNPITVSHIAKQAGLAGYDKYLDVSGMDDAAIMEAAEQYSIFGRVTPRQKQMLLRALQEAGHTTAMLGDGVNDILALKEADCSIAMASGSDATRQISQIVLLNNQFSSLPSVVMEGRRVINNITRTASLFLVKTTFSFILTLLMLVFQLAYPFKPIQLSLISTLTVGIPSFFLALEPNRAKIKGNFLANVLQRAVPGGICVVLYVMLANVFSNVLGLTADQLNTLCVYATGITGLCILLRTCFPLDWKRFGLWAVMTMAFFAAAYVARDVLMLSTWTQEMVWSCIVLGACCYPILLGLQKLTTVCIQGIQNRTNAKQRFYR